MTPTPNPNPTTAPEDPADGTPASRSRRALLAALASGATTALAGCANQTTTTTAGLTPSPGNDDGTATPSPTATATATPTSGQAPLSELTAWAYPREFRNPEVAYRLRRFDLETMRANSGVVRDAVLEFARGELEDLAYVDTAAAPSEVATLSIIDDNYVYKGPWGKAEMQDQASQFTNVKAEGSRGAYALYRDTATDAALAITDGELVVAHRGEGNNVKSDSALAVLKRMLAAKRGTKPRYGQVSEAFRAVMAQTVQRGYYSSGLFHDPYTSNLYSSGHVKHVTASGQTLAIQDGAITSKAPYLFDTEAHANKSRIEKLAEEYWTYLKNPTVTQQSPRLFTIAGTITTSN